MLPLADSPHRPPDAPGCGCGMAVLLGVLIWAAWTAAAFMLGQVSVLLTR